MRITMIESVNELNNPVYYATKVDDEIYYSLVSHSYVAVPTLRYLKPTLVEHTKFCDALDEYAKLQEENPVLSTNYIFVPQRIEDRY